jgi:hypothetical protein
MIYRPASGQVMDAVERVIGPRFCFGRETEVRFAWKAESLKSLLLLAQCSRRTEVMARG